MEQPILIKRKHELSDLLKQLDRASPAAVQLLVEKMQDEKTPLKERLKCAETIVHTQIKVAETISKDQLVRTVADIKLKGGYTPTLDATGKKPAGPSINFEDIQEV